MSRPAGTAPAGIRFEASEANATNRPSPLIDGPRLAPSAGFASNPTLTSLVWPVSRSRTNTSSNPFVSPGTRFVAREVNATKRPSALTDGSRLKPSACLPLLLTLTRSVSPLARSRTKTSIAALVSPPTRLAAIESKATTSPSALTAGGLNRALMLSACLPLLRTLTISVSPGPAAAPPGCTANTSPSDAATIRTEMRPRHSCRPSTCRSLLEDAWCLPDVHEDVGGRAGVARHEVVRVGLERADRSIVGDLRPFAAAVRLRPGAADAHPRRGAALAVADEDVAAVVGVPGDQVRGDRLEGDVAAVGGDVGAAAELVARVAGAVDADPLEPARGPVADQDMALVASIPDQVGGDRLEGDEAAVRADDRNGAVAIAAVPGRVLADALGLPRDAIVQEHLEERRGRAGDEVLGAGGEHDEPAVGAESGQEAGTVPAHAGAVHAGALGRSGEPVVDEHVVGEVVVAGDEVVGTRMEGHESAVRADRRPVTEPVRLAFCAAHADPLGGTGEPVADEDVRRAVPVLLHQVRRFRRESDESAVGADRRVARHADDSAVPVALTALAVHADALGRAGDAITNEDVGDAVGVLWHQVAGLRGERDDPAVRADRRHLADEIRFRAAAADAHPLGDAGRGRRRTHDHTKQSHQRDRHDDDGLHPAPPHPHRAPRSASATR